MAFARKQFPSLQQTRLGSKSKILIGSSIKISFMIVPRDATYFYNKHVQTGAINFDLEDRSFYLKASILKMPCCHFFLHLFTTQPPPLGPTSHLETFCPYHQQSNQNKNQVQVTQETPLACLNITKGLICQKIFTYPIIAVKAVGTKINYITNGIPLSYHKTTRKGLIFLQVIT